MPPHEPVAKAHAKSLPRSPLLADDLPDLLDLLSEVLIGGDYVVKGVGYLAQETRGVARHRTEKSPIRMACKARRRW